jgi:hypothetical protein
MWDTIAEMTAQTETVLSRDLPCPHCGHECHRYVGCDAPTGCDCPATPLPGDVAVPHQR